MRPRARARTVWANAICRPLVFTARPSVVVHAPAERARSLSSWRVPLEIPLRTVQSALAEMVSEGVLRSEGKGRSVRYIVEDTVFNEPTRS